MTDLKAHIKDLELQVDYLIGYKPQGMHWKQEFHLRDEMIASFISDDTTPPEMVDKVNRIMERIYELRNGIENDQTYLQAHEDQNIERVIKMGGIDEGKTIVLTGKRSFPTYNDWHAQI